MQAIPSLCDEIMASTVRYIENSAPRNVCSSKTAVCCGAAPCILAATFLISSTVVCEIVIGRFDTNL
jgi:hypothetical protein